MVVYSKLAGITPTPTGPKVRRELLELLPDIDGPVYELGSGWGTLTAPLAKRYSHVIGYEMSPVPWACAALRSVRHRSLSCRFGNFWKRDLSDAKLIVCYLYPEAMKRLVDHLPKGCTVVTHTFAIPNLTPVKTVRADDLYRTPIYTYQT